jgi:predicted Zn finger-like uncharacterized protein
MKFVCDRCQTKYSIADDKVRGKVLKVRCKTCQNVITVREPGARPSVGSLQPVRTTKPSTGPLTTLGEDANEPAERTMLAPAPAGLMADLAQPRRATPPPPPPVGDGIEWFIAIEGAQQGPFTRRALVDKLIALSKDADVHVWNDGMDGWKPPKDVPELVKDLAARRPPAPPVPPGGRPRTTPSPPLPPTAARRAPTQPLASGVGVKLPLPTGAVAAHAVPAPHHEDPAAGMPTPGPSPIHAPAHGHAPVGRKTNGISAHSSSPGVALPGSESDALSALNLGGSLAAAPAAAPAGKPRLMEVAAATSWEGQPSASGKKRGTTMVVALMGVVAAIIVVALVSLGKKPAVVNAGVSAAKGGLDSEALARSAEAVAHEPQKPIPTEKPAEQPERGKPVPHGSTRGARPATGRGGTSPGALTSGATTVAAAGEDPNSRYMETGGRKVTAPVVQRRPPPGQSDIMRVIANNKLGIKTCYQRALVRDSSLARGKIIIGLTIGISGRVKRTNVEGPTSFRALEPCIKEMVARWVFPQADEEYTAEFPIVFQGNE